MITSDSYKLPLTIMIITNTFTKLLFYSVKSISDIVNEILIFDDSTQNIEKTKNIYKPSDLIKNRQIDLINSYPFIDKTLIKYII